MRTVGRRASILMICVLAAAGGLGLAGAKAGLFARFDRAYAEWSLRSRVEALSRTRVAGDVEKASGFVIKSCEPRAPLGSAIRYYSFDLREMNVEGNVAEVKLGVSYAVALPGFHPESAPPDYTDMRQRWVRAGWTWYWDPGPIPTAGSPVRLEPASASR